MGGGQNEPLYYIFAYLIQTVYNEHIKPLEVLKVLSDLYKWLKFESCITFIYTEYSWLSLVRTRTGLFNFSNYREIQITESNLVVFLFGGEWKWVRIIERFEL